MSKDTGGPALNVTKEGIEVKPGQVWQDLDKRMMSGNRKCVVVSVAHGKARMQLATNFIRATTLVSISRMRKGSTGWALVSDAS